MNIVQRKLEKCNAKHVTEKTLNSCVKLKTKIQLTYSKKGVLPHSPSHLNYTAFFFLFIINSINIIANLTIIHFQLSVEHSVWSKFS